MDDTVYMYIPDFLHSVNAYIIQNCSANVDFHAWNLCKDLD